MEEETKAREEGRSCRGWGKETRVGERLGLDFTELWASNGGLSEAVSDV